jgi:hypothetical protein
MLTLEQCRVNLPDKDQRSISDEMLSELREQLQIFSEIFVEHALTLEINEITINKLT